MNRTSGFRFLPLCPVFLLGVTGSSALGETVDTFSLSLEGEHLFHVGDAPGRAEPDFDDSGWVRAPVPGVWQNHGMGEYAAFGWMRIWFELPGELPDDLAVRFGELGICADEVFLNGEIIGGMGKISRRGYEVASQGRVYRLPEKFLRKGGRNLIALRQCRFTDTAGIRAGPVVIGSYPELKLAQTENDEWNQRLELVALLALLGAGVLIFLLICYEKDWKLETASLLFLFLSGAGALFAASHLADDLELAGHWLFVRAGSVFVFVFIASYLTYLKSVLRFRFGWVMKIAFSMFSILSGIYVWFPDWANHYLTGTASPLAPVLNVVTLVLVLGSNYRMVVGLRRREPGMLLLFLAILFLTGGVLVSFSEVTQVFGVSLAAAAIGLQLLAITGFVGCLLGTVGIRFMAARERVAELSNRVRKVEEEERRRISRDLHDGVAQNLQALRLRAQVLDQDRGGTVPEWREFSEALEGVIEEVRETSHALRPHFLEETTLINAMEWHGSHQWGDKLELEIAAREWDDARLSSVMKEHVFRTFQEAVSNALKHGGATRFQAGLRPLGKDRLEIVFEDNGRGFDPVEVDSDGIGLSTMRERIELLGGSFELQSGDDGTTIRLVFPAASS